MTNGSPVKTCFAILPQSVYGPNLMTRSESVLLACLLDNSERNSNSDYHSHPWATPLVEEKTLRTYWKTKKRIGVKETQGRENV